MAVEARDLAPHDLTSDPVPTGCRERPRAALLADRMATRFVQAGVPIVVLNTHLNANYSGDWRPTNRYTHNEREQLRQLAEIVAACRPR